MDYSLDPRHIANGYEIPTETYSDQPYIVQTQDGGWLCVMTTGAGLEGEVGQHIVTTRSTDRGRSWSAPVDVESPDGPESSYAVLLQTPSGRIFCFYNYNGDNLRSVRADDPPYTGGICQRVDTLGHHVFKVSEDGGRSWSQGRWRVPVRNFAIDRANPYGGEIQFFWNVGKPFLHEGSAYISLHKVGGFGEGFMTSSQGVLIRSDNLLTADDLADITWETLPEGDVGLRTPPGGGPVSDEQSTVVLSDGTFYCVYRTMDGHPVCARSRDRGRTWSEPRYQAYADGRRMKHPRAANFVWKCRNGRYLYWFHNHGGRFIREHPQQRSIAYQDRNPVWLCGGVEIDTPAGKTIAWSQPEIVLYDDDPWIRMSYPDLVEEDGRYFLRETQKDVARVHDIEPALLEGLWAQLADAPPIGRQGGDLLLALPRPGEAMPTTAPLPELPTFTRRSDRTDHGTADLRAGLTLDVWARFNSLDVGQVLLDNRTVDGRGFCLHLVENGVVELVLHDGRCESRWTCDAGLLDVERKHHIVAIVDGGPKIIMFMVDGVLCDGGEQRQFGWGRFNPHWRGPAGEATLTVGTVVHSLRIYGQALRTSQAIGNFRAETH